MSKYYLYVDKNGHNNYSIALDSEYETLKKVENISFDQAKELICKYDSLAPEYIYNGFQTLPYYFINSFERV